MKKGVGCWSACKACCIDKVKCKWITGSHADSEEGGSISGAVASSFQVASLSQVASSSQVARSSLPQPEVHASVDALWEIAEAIHDVQCRQEEQLQQVEDCVQCTLDAMEWLVQVLVDRGAWKVAERELVSHRWESAG